MLLIHLFLPLLYAGLFFFSFPDKGLYLQFVAGVFLGFSIFFIDRVTHVFFVQPETEFSHLVQKAWKDKKIREMLKLLLMANTLQEQLITRSVLFMFIYVILTIFIVTSTGSSLGVGIMLGMGLHFCLDFFLYRKNIQDFHKHFLWQIKRQLAEQEINVMLGTFWLFFLIVTLLVLI